MLRLTQPPDLANYVRLEELISFLVVQVITGRDDAYWNLFAINFSSYAIRNILAITADDAYNEADTICANFLKHVQTNLRDSSQYKPPIDASIEDDIHKQNKCRTRSITELVSNSVDSGAQCVSVVVRDGCYQILDNGSGMSPYDIFHHLLLPKSSSKDGVCGIGRFGIGFFTTLAHLQTEQDRVILRTKKANYQGYRIEFLKHEGKIYLTVDYDAEILENGTIIEVRSADIKEEQYVSALSDNVRYCSANIIINGARINPNFLHAQKIDFATSVKVVSSVPGQYKYAIITVGGITIQTEKHKRNSNTLTVVWDLPKTTSFSENRSEVRIDTVDLFNKICTLINYYAQLPPDIQLQYLNSIAPLIESLQRNNALYGEGKNIMVFYKNAITAFLKGIPCIPDRKQFRAIQHPHACLLHPHAVSEDWRSRVTRTAQEYQGSKTTVLLAPEVRGNFIYDRDTNTVYMDERYYQDMIANPHDRWKLELIFSLPPGTMDVKLQQSSSLVCSEGNTAKAQFIRDLQTRYCATDLIEEAESLPNYEILRSAKSLFRVFPAHLTTSYAKQEQTSCFVRVSDFDYRWINKISEIYTYTYQNKKYYLLNGYYITDHNFCPLFGKHNMLLLAKMTQLHEQGITDCEVELSQDDRLAIYNPLKKIAEVCDGLGNIVLTDKIWENAEVLRLNHDYFVVIEGFLQNENDDISSLYNLSGQLIATFPSVIELLSLEPLLIRNNISRNYRYSVFDVEKRKMLVDYCKKLTILENGLYVRYTEKHIKIINKYGNTIFSLKTDEDFCKFYSNRKLYIKHVNNLVYIFTSNRGYYPQRAEQNKLIVISYENQIPPNTHQEMRDIFAIIGSPPIGYIERTAEDIFKYICLADNSTRVLHGIVAIKFLDYGIDEENKEILLCRYQKGNTYTKALFDMRGNFVNLPNNISQELKIRRINRQDFFNGEQEDNIYIINYRESNNFLIIDKNGHLIITGQGGRETIKTRHSIFFLAGYTLYDKNGKIITEQVKYCYPVEEDNGFILHVQTTDEKQFLINNHHELIVINEYRCFKNKTAYIEFSDKSLVQYSGAPELQYCDDYNEQMGLYLIGSEYNLPERFYLDDRFRPIFPEQIPEGFSLTKITKNCFLQHNDKNRVASRIYYQLSNEQLQSPTVILNIAFLNERNLTFEQYGSCLRFCELQPEYFCALFPYMQEMLCVPDVQQAAGYIDLFSFMCAKGIENHSMAVKTLDFIYFILSGYAMPDVHIHIKIQNILEFFGIKVLDDFYQELVRYRYQLQLFFNDFTEHRAIFDEMPQQIGQIAYYMFCGASDLLIQRPEMEIDYTHTNQLSLREFVTVCHLNTDILLHADDPRAFIGQIQQLMHEVVTTDYCWRKVMHAVLHQADPNKHLYLRELLQNCLDAYAAKMHDQIPHIPIEIYQNAAGKCVLSFRDHGVGMNLHDVFAYLLMPGFSLKRHSQEGDFIGGRGVGFFTIFYSAEYVTLKTGTGDGFAHYFRFTPICTDNGELINIAIQWHTVEENFQGTLVERVSLHASEASLDAALYHRAVKTHAKCIDANTAIITINNFQLNHTLQLFAAMDIPNIGKVEIFYSEREKAVTAGGLFVKDFSEEWFADIPPFIRKLILKHNIIINFPKNVALNRERNDFEDSEQFIAYVKPFLVQMAIEFYCNMVLQNKAKLEELPYDFFDRFKLNRAQIIARNPNIESDAAQLNAGGMLTGYSPYKAEQNLIDLLCFLEFIPHKDPRTREIKKYSLMQLADMYWQGMLSDDSDLPPQIKAQISFSKQMAENCRQAKQTIQEDRFLYKRWRLGSDDYISANAQHWSSFLSLSMIISDLLSPQKRITFYWSTCDTSALASTFIGTTKIYWNPISVQPILKRLIRSLQQKQPNEFSKVLRKIVYAISHELIHIDEGSDSATHNKSFYEKQRLLLLKKLPDINTEQLFQECRQYYQQHIDDQQPLLPAKQFIENTLGPLLDQQTREVSLSRE